MQTQSENWVQVQIHFELPVYIPYADADGALAFRKTDVASEYGLKVKVPEYATETEDALNQYLQDCYWGKDFVSPQHANIWVDEEDHEYGGYFKFKWSSGVYDY